MPILDENNWKIQIGIEPDKTQNQKVIESMMREISSLIKKEAPDIEFDENSVDSIAEAMKKLGMALNVVKDEQSGFIKSFSTNIQSASGAIVTLNGNLSTTVKTLRDLKAENKDFNFNSSQWIEAAKSGNLFDKQGNTVGYRNRGQGDYILENVSMSSSTTSYKNNPKYMLQEIIEQYKLLQQVQNKLSINNYEVIGKQVTELRNKLLDYIDTHKDFINQNQLQPTLTRNEFQLSNNQYKTEQNIKEKIAQIDRQLLTADQKKISYLTSQKEQYSGMLRVLESISRLEPKNLDQRVLGSKEGHNESLSQQTDRNNRIQSENELISAYQKHISVLKEINSLDKSGSLEYVKLKQDEIAVLEKQESVLKKRVQSQDSNREKEITSDFNSQANEIVFKRVLDIQKQINANKERQVSSDSRTIELLKQQERELENQKSALTQNVKLTQEQQSVVNNTARSGAERVKIAEQTKAQQDLISNLKEQFRIQKELDSLDAESDRNFIEYKQNEIQELKSKEQAIRSNIVYTESLQNAEKALAKEIESYNAKKVDKDNKRAQKEDLEQIDRVVDKYKELERARLALNKLNIQKGSSVAMQEERNNIVKLNNELNKLERTRLSNGKTVKETAKYEKEVAAAHEKTQRELRALDDKYKQVTVSLSHFIDGARSVVGNVFNYNLAWNAFQQLGQAITASVQKVRELDNAMTQIRLVTGETNVEVQKTISNYIDLAKQLGVTTQAVADGSLEWLRQGKTAEETSELLKQSTIFAKLGALEASDATEKLTAIMNSYKYSTEDAVDVVDKLVGIDLIAATSTEELSTALQRSASLAEASGVSFNKMIGLITTASETTRMSAETLGNSMRSIFARMENVKAGKDIDEFGEKINDVEKVLDRFGIKLRKTPTQFRDLEEVLDDVATKWTNLDNVEQQQIATAIAGSYQRNTFVAIMENYGKVLEYTTKATQMAGSSQQKYEAYLDSIEAKVNQLTSTWEGMVNNFNAGDAYRGVIEGATKAVELLDFLLNDLNILKTFVLPATFIVGFNKLAKVLNSAKDGIKKFITAYGNVGQIVKKSDAELINFGKSLNGLSDMQKKLILSTQSLTTQQQKLVLVSSGVTEAEADQMVQTRLLSAMQQRAATSTNVLKRAWDGLKAAIASNPIGAVLLIATTAIASVTKVIKDAEEAERELIEEGRELRESFNATFNEIESSISSLSELNGEFSELSKGVDKNGKNISLSADQYSRYKDIVKQIVELNPSLIQGYSEETGYIIDKNKAIEETIELLKKQKEIELSERILVDNLMKTLKEFEKNYRDAVDEISGSEFNLFDHIMYAFSPKNSDYSNENYAKIIAEAIGIENIDEEIQNLIGEKGYFQLTDFIDKYAKDIASNMDVIISTFKQSGDFEVDDSALSGIREYANIVLKDFNSMNIAFEKIKDELGLIIEYETSINNLSSNQNRVLQTMIDNLKPEDIMTDDKLDEEKVEKFKDRMHTLSEDLTKTIKDSNQSINDALESLFNIDKSNINVGEYSDYVRDRIDEIVNSLEQATEAEREDYRLRLYVDLGVDFRTDDGQETDSAESAINHITEYFSTDMRDRFLSLSQEEFEVLMQIYARLDPNSNFDEIVNEIRMALFNATQSQISMQDVMISFGESIDIVYQKFNMMDTAIEQFNTHGAISVETFNNLINNNLLQYLDFVNGKLVVNTEALRQAEVEAKKKALTDLSLSYAENILAIATESVTKEEEEGAIVSDGYSKAAHNLAGKISEIAPQALNGALAIRELNSALKDEGTSFVLTQDRINAINKVTDEYKKNVELVQMTMRDNAPANSYFGGITNGAKSATGATKELKNEVQDLQNHLQEQQRNIQSLLDMTIKMIRQRKQDEKEALQEEMKTLQERYQSEKDYLNDLKKQKEKEFKAEKDRIDKLKKDENDRYKKRKEQIENERDAILDSYEDQIDALEEEAKLYADKIQAEKDLLKLKEDEYQYEKELEEKQRSVSEIQEQLAALELDNSISAQKKKLELADELAKRQEELSELQHDRDVELQEGALDSELDRFNNLQDSKIEKLEEEKEKQKELYEQQLEQLENIHNQYINDLENRLDLLDQEKEAWEEAHQNRMDALDDEYNRHREMLQQQIDDITDYLSREGQIRRDAIDMIESRYEGFYEDLVAWNAEYGTGVTADVTNAWNLAYAALEEFAGPDGTIRVQDALETIATQMYRIKNDADGVANSFRNAANAIDSASSALSRYNSMEMEPDDWNHRGSGGGGMNDTVQIFHDGVSYVKKKRTPLDKALGVKEDETVAILQVGEAVIPKMDNSRSKDPVMSSIERKNRNNNNSINKLFYASSGENVNSVRIGDIVISGNATQETVELLRRERENLVKNVFEKIESHSKRSAYRNMKALV